MDYFRDENIHTCVLGYGESRYQSENSEFPSFPQPPLYNRQRQWNSNRLHSKGVAVYGTILEKPKNIQNHSQVYFTHLKYDIPNVKHFKNSETQYYKTYEIRTITVTIIITMI